jgi:2-hydroxychromene-2-carboxylate isomerase
VSTMTSIDYNVWLLSDWADLGGVRFTQMAARMAARHGLKINHIPMHMPDVYAGSGGVLLLDRSWQRQAYRIHELMRWSARLGMKLNIEPRFSQPTIRAQYRDNTRRALAAGVFGSPFCVYAGEIFWGQDRLDMLEEVIVRSRAGTLGRRPDNPGSAQ